MQKRLRVVSIIVVAFLTLLALSGGQAYSADLGGGLEGGLELRIKRDFYYAHGMDKTWEYGGVTYSYTCDDVFITRFYGLCSSGAAVMMMTASGLGYTQALTSETVAGLKFRYSDSNQITVWHDGKFHKLGDTRTRHYEIVNGEYVYGEWETVPGAYTLGLLTLGELLCVHSAHHSAVPHLWKY